MKTKLFENIEGNKFRLLKESTLDENKTYVQSGLKKVFSNAGNNISYRQIESVGMGYIRDINSAKQFALQEAREIAESFGYKDNEEEAKFIKDSPNVRPLKKEDHDETNMNSPEEKREVQIGKAILSYILAYSNENVTEQLFLDGIKKLAEELIKMHEGK
jgi:hypothetical protein